MKPLYKWAGGKTRLIKHYKPLLPEDVRHYYEPFFGGGALYCHMMDNYPIRHAWINDVSPDLMGIYVALKDDAKRFIALCHKREDEYLPLDWDGRHEYYNDLRHEHAWDYEKWDQTEQAAALFFLMRTCFNGLFLQRKKTNMRFGTSRGPLTEKFVFDYDNLVEWHAALQRTTITVGDWREAMPDPDDERVGTFVFLDPPYRDASEVDYCSPFTEDDLLDLISRATELRNAWVTNRDIDDGFFEKNSGTLEIERFPIKYTAGQRQKGVTAKKAVEVLLHT